MTADEVADIWGITDRTCNGDHPRMGCDWEKCIAVAERSNKPSIGRRMISFERISDGVERENVSASVLWDALVEVAKLYCTDFEDALPACGKCIVCLARRYVKEHSKASLIHAHKWTDARNEVVQDGEICLECGAIRPGNQTADA